MIAPTIPATHCNLLPLLTLRRRLTADQPLQRVARCMGQIIIQKLKAQSDMLRCLKKDKKSDGKQVSKSQAQRSPGDGAQSSHNHSLFSTQNVSWSLWHEVNRSILRQQKGTVDPRRTQLLPNGRGEFRSANS